MPLHSSLGDTVTLHPKKRKDEKKRKEREGRKGRGHSKARASPFYTEDEIVSKLERIGEIRENKAQESNPTKLGTPEVISKLCIHESDSK